MHLIELKNCADHRLEFLGECPFCKAGLEPSNVLDARLDFAGKPVAGVRDVLPHQVAVRLEDVVRSLALQLSEVTRLEAKALEPFLEIRKELVTAIRKAQMEPVVFNRAARIHAGMPGAEFCASDPAVAMILGMMR
jgi:hypothetical protein